MNTTMIAFTDIGKAEHVTGELPKVKADEVMAKMEYTVVSGGTEYANLMGLKNTPSAFPKVLGYCGVGIAVEVGAEVCPHCKHFVDTGKKPYTPISEKKAWQIKFVLGIIIIAIFLVMVATK